jgi:hypothetical protein
VPSLRRAPGARFATIRSRGQRSPSVALMADRVRCSASRTDLAGRPTIEKPGMPESTSTSTWTMRASVPTSANDSVVASKDHFRSRLMGERGDEESSRGVGQISASAIRRHPRSDQEASALREEAVRDPIRRRLR